MDPGGSVAGITTEKQPESQEESRGSSEEASMGSKLKVPWVKVAQATPYLKEHVVDLEIKDGKELVEVPDEVIQNTVPLWEDLVVGKFPTTAPHVARVHIIVNKIWTLGNKAIRIDSFEMNETMIKFRIKDEATRNRIVRRGMWNISGMPMVVSKWAPVTEEEEEVEIKTIPMLIKNKNVPPRMFSWEGLGFIPSAVGKPKRLHPDTLLCTSFEEEKVFVEAEVAKGFPKKHRFKSKLGVDAEVEFVYPWLPSRCSICQKWGHVTKDCKANEVVKPLKKAGTEQTTPEVSKTTEEAGKEEGEVEKEKEKEL
ncbi:hypothetical protein Bca4012_010759 [Brassica carinata]